MRGDVLICICQQHAGPCQAVCSLSLRTREDETESIMIMLLLRGVYLSDVYPCVQSYVPLPHLTGRHGPTCVPNHEPSCLRVEEDARSGKANTRWPRCWRRLEEDGRLGVPTLLVTMG